MSRFNKQRLEIQKSIFQLNFSTPRHHLLQKALQRECGVETKRINTTPLLLRTICSNIEGCCSVI